MRNPHSFIRQAALLLTLCLCLSLPVSAAGRLSPALDILANRLRLAKSSLAGTDISFSEEDFDWAVNARVSSVTVTSLPQGGTLYLDGRPLSAAAVISRRQMDELTFRPQGLAAAESSFTLQLTTDGGSYPLTCSLYLTEELNLAPTAALTGPAWRELSAHAGVSCPGLLRADDPENDPLTYHIVSAPRRGRLELTDASTGAFTYTPGADVSGRDSFVYQAVDSLGNRSEPVTVRIAVEPADGQAVFRDMAGHWAENAALTAAEAGLMTGAGRGEFAPDLPVSRGEFLTWAMQAAGYTVLGSRVTTGFADDAAIPTSCRGYVAAALERGFIRGTLTEEGYCFNAGSPITRAEAAVMLQNILGLQASGALPAFADRDALPVWAAGAMNALSEAGIFRGSPGGELAPMAVLDRAQTAQILSGVLAIMD